MAVSARTTSPSRFLGCACGLLLRDSRHAIKSGRNLLLGAAGPEDFDGFDLFGISQADGHGKFGLREVTAGWHDLARQGSSGDSHFDPGANSVAVAFDAG